MGGVEGGCRSQVGFWNRSIGRPRQVGVSQGYQGLGICVPVRAVEIRASASRGQFQWEEFLLLSSMNYFLSFVAES